MKSRNFRQREGALLAVVMGCAGWVLAALMWSAPVQAGQRAGDASTVALAQADVSAAQDAGRKELKALTQQVLQSLGAITGKKPDGTDSKGNAETAKAAAGDYEALMKSLNLLVEKATRQGRNSEDVYALIQEALASQDDATLEALIARAGGKVELEKLLRALVQKAALQYAGNDPYTRQLQQEGEHTRVLEATATARQPAEAVSSGENGRTIVVQPGDTLSIIALKVYGSAGRWRSIYEANRDKLANPDMVPAGVVLRLP